MKKKITTLNELRGLIREELKTLLRETPGDAVYVELTGAMRTFQPDSDLHAIESLPIHLQSMDVEDPEWNNYPDHDLYIMVTDRNGDFSRFEWDIVGVDIYELEPHDSDKIKAYLKTQPELYQQIEDTLVQREADREASIG